MRATELIPGEDYILDILNQPTATFEGRQSDFVNVFDGAGVPVCLGGYAGWLRFRTIDNPRIVFIPDGAKVVESAHAKAERERVETARNAVFVAAVEDATALLEAYGLRVAMRNGDTLEGAVWLAANPHGPGVSDDFEIDGFTIGHLRQIIGAVIVDERSAGE